MPTTPDTKYFFIVGGNEYDHKNLGFLTKCNHRVTERIRVLESLKTRATIPYDLTLPVNLVFFRFAFGDGTVHKVEYLLESGAKPPFEMTEDAWKTPLKISDLGQIHSIPDKLRALTSGEYLYFDDPPDRHGRVHRHYYLVIKEPIVTPRPMSITDVYQCIRQAPAGSVLDLSIFSHANWLGPILTNTNDNVNTVDKDTGIRTITDLRSVADTDGRSYVDFKPNMGLKPSTADNLSAFKKAFSSKAEIHVWGCDSSPSETERIHSVLRQIQGVDPLDPSTPIRVKVTRKIKKVSKTFTKTVTYKAFKAHSGREIADSYPFQCADLTGITTFGMFPGTSSDNSGYELMGLYHGHPLTLSFYTKFLEMKADENGYAIYDAAAVAWVKYLVSLA